MQVHCLLKFIKLLVLLLSLKLYGQVAVIKKPELIQAFLCTGCTVYRDHMDVKERVCTGCTVSFLFRTKTMYLHPCKQYRDHMDVKERVCTGLSQTSCLSMH